MSPLLGLFIENWLWVNIKQNCPSVTEMLHKYTAKTADENDGINTELQPNSVTIRTKRMDLASWFSNPIHSLEIWCCKIDNPKRNNRNTCRRWPGQLSAAHHLVLSVRQTWRIMRATKFEPKWGRQRENVVISQMLSFTNTIHNGQKLT